jgi:lipoic acid synthetase
VYFCNVATGRPLPVDLKEPERVAKPAMLMKIKHCAITSVDHDDLKYGGAIIWVETINAIRRVSPQTRFETERLWNNYYRKQNTFVNPIQD